MVFLTEYGLFLAKCATVVIAILIILSAFAGMSSKTKDPKKIKVKKVNRQLDELKNHIDTATLSKSALKAQKTTAKKDKKSKKKESKPRPRLFIIRFKGDIKASQVKSLRQEITAILLAAKQDDRVLLCLESPGGMVPNYGLAASQLARLKDAGLPLTIAVDNVAASGGYMMACVADHIIAAPFAIIGSIGVVFQLPNLHRFLDKKHIDHEMLTAGEYKRTLTVMGKNTTQGRNKMQIEIDETHALFKEHISQFRPQVDMDTVATGEHWYGTQALTLQLIDAIQTSDDYILDNRDQYDIFEITQQQKQSALQKITAQGSALLQSWCDDHVLVKKP